MRFATICRCCNPGYVAGLPAPSVRLDTGGGLLGYLCCDAITCLSFGFAGFRRGAVGTGGLRCTACTGCTGPRPRADQRTAGPTSRPGLEKAHPVTGGAGGRRAGVSAAHKMASTSAISAATSGSRARISNSRPPIVRLSAGTAAVPKPVIIGHPCPHRPADQALMTL
jgi:hypothetical protein